MLPFSLPEVDARLPGSGMQLGVLHEVTGCGNGALDHADCALFAAGIAALTPDKVLWCILRQDLSTPAPAQARRAAEQSGTIGIATILGPIADARW